MSHRDIHNYDDIIDLPHHVSKSHPQMSLHDRAMQFAPFAALTGHKEAVNEKGRFTQQKKILDENLKDILNAKLQNILENIKEHPIVTMTYFQKDKKKDGGEYVTVTGRIKKIDNYERVILMMNDIMIKIDDIYEIE